MLFGLAIRAGRGEARLGRAGRGGAQRVQHPRWLLESTDDPLSSIAGQCGLGTEANLRHHFTRLAGVAPAHYRRVFKNQPAKQRLV